MEQKSISTEGIANLLWKYRLSQLFKNKIFLVGLGVVLFNFLFFKILSLFIVCFFIVYISAAKIYLITKYRMARKNTIYPYLNDHVYLVLNDLGFSFGEKTMLSTKYHWKDFSSYKIFKKPGILLVKSHEFKTIVVFYKKDMNSVDFEILMSFVQHNIKEGILID